MTALDVSSLRLLQAIAEHRTLTSAAESLGISQPAASQHVRRLERTLGTALLERMGRGVRLTEAGRVLARHGETVTAALNAAEGEVRALAGLQSGVVRLVAFPSSTSTLVPSALARLRGTHPGITVELQEVEPPESIALVRAGSADLALAFTYPGVELGRGRDDLRGLATIRLLDDPTTIALPQGHPLAGRDSISLADLSHERWIAGCPRCRGHLEAASAECGFTPEIGYATDDYSAVFAFVAAGLGVAMLPSLVRGVGERHPGVVVRDLERAMPRTVHAVTTPDLLRVPGVVATLEALRASVEEHRS